MKLNKKVKNNIIKTGDDDYNIKICFNQFFMCWEIGNFSSDYGCPIDEETGEKQQYEYSASEYEYKKNNEKEKEQNKFDKELKKLQERVLNNK